MTDVLDRAHRLLATLRVAEDGRLQCDPRGDEHVHVFYRGGTRCECGRRSTDQRFSRIRIECDDSELGRILTQEVSHG